MVGQSNEKQPWQNVIGQGWVWAARINRLKWIPVLFTVGFIASIGWDVVSTSENVSNVAASQTDRQAVSGWQRFKYEPMTTLVNAVRRATDNPRPRFNPDSFMRLGLWGGDASTQIGSVQDLRGWVDVQIAALDKTGRLDSSAGECVEFSDLSTLAGKVDGSQVFCKASGSDRIWIVSRASKGGYAVPVFAVVRKTDSGWRWFDVWAGVEQGALGARVLPDMIAQMMSADMPMLFN